MLEYMLTDMVTDALLMPAQSTNRVVNHTLYNASGQDFLRAQFVLSYLPANLSASSPQMTTIQSFCTTIVVPDEATLKLSKIHLIQTK
jgi:hypothetical protein